VTERVSEWVSKWDRRWTQLALMGGLGIPEHANQGVVVCSDAWRAFPQRFGCLRLLLAGRQATKTGTGRAPSSRLASLVTPGPASHHSSCGSRSPHSLIQFFSHSFSLACMYHVYTQRACMYHVYTLRSPKHKPSEENQIYT